MVTRLVSFAPLLAAAGCALTACGSGGDLSPDSPAAAPSSSSSSTPPSAASTPRPRCAADTSTTFVTGAPAGVSTSTKSVLGPDVIGVDVNHEVDGVVTDGTSLYWVLAGPEGGRIVSAPIAAGDPVTLIDESGEGTPTNLVVRDGRLWWVERPTSDSGRGRIMTAAIDGSGVHPLGASEPSVGGMVVYGGNAYASVGTAIVRVDGTTGARDTVHDTGASRDIMMGLAVDDLYVYTFLQHEEETTATLLGFPKAGGDPVPLAEESVSADEMSVSDLAADGSHVIWAIYPYPPVVRAIPAGGGPVTTLGSTHFGAVSLSPEGDWVYFAAPGANPPRIERLALAPGTAFASDVLMDGSNDGRFAVAGATLYWGGYDDNSRPAVRCAAVR